MTRRTFENTVALLQDLGHRVEPTKGPVPAQFGEDLTQLFALFAFGVSRAGDRSAARPR